MGYPTTTSKNLGLVQAIVAAVTPPENIYQIWVDLSQTPFVHKYWNTQLSQWIPLQSIVVDENNNFSLPLGTQAIFVSEAGNDATGAPGNISKTFASITAAITAAKALAPASNNVVSIVVFPGTYSESPTVDADWIDIITAVPQPQIYNKTLVGLATTAAGINYTYSARKTNIVGTLTMKNFNNKIIGIDMSTLVLLSNGATCNNYYENIFAQQIQSLATASGQICQGTFVDVHAVAFLASDGLTVIQGDFQYCGTAGGFGQGTGGNLQSASFKNCYGGDGSFGGAGAAVSNCTFENVITGNTCFYTCNYITLTNCTVGNNCFNVINNSTLTNVSGGSGCCNDFNTCTFTNCIFGSSFAYGGSLPVLIGNFYNVTADWSEGFANGRPWRGNMRRMYIQSTDAAKACLNVSSTPTAVAVIEHSVLKNCDGGDVIDGNYAEISYCRFNKNYSITNTLGSNSLAFNVVSSSLCSYTPGGSVATCPVVTGISAVNNNGTLNVSCTVVAGDPSNAVTGIQINYYDPAVGTSGIISVNVGVSAAGVVNTTIPNVTPNIAYMVSVITDCVGNTSSTPTYVAATTVAARPTAWRGRQSDSYCQQGQATYSVTSISIISGNHTAQRTFDDGGGNSVTWNYTIQCSSSENFSVTFAPGVLSVAVTGTGLGCNALVTPTLTNQSWSSGRSTANTGYQVFVTLEQYYTDVTYSTTNPAILTGLTKPNVNTDPNYAPPVFNVNQCPLPSSVGVPVVYARLVKVGVSNTPISQLCNGVMTIVGNQGNATLEIQLFSDFAGTVPLTSLAGTGITQVNLQQTYDEVGTYVSTTAVPVNVTLPGSGNTIPLGSFEDHYTNNGCNNLVTEATEQNWSYTLVSIQGRYTAIS